MSLAILNILVGLIVASTVIAVSQVGKIRKPLTSGSAAVVVAFGFLEVAGLIYVALNL